MDDLTEAVSGGGAAARGPGSPGAPRAPAPLPKALAPKARGGTAPAQGGFNALHPRTAKGRVGGGQFAKKSKAASSGQQQQRGPQSIAQFQKSRGLPVTGKMDQATAIAMRNAGTAKAVDAQAAAALKAQGKASVTVKSKGPVVKLGRNEYAKVGMGSAGHPDARVLKVQDTLEKLGYDVARSGVFGPELVAAVRQFQKDHGLPVTGVVSIAALRRMETLRARIAAARPTHGALSADSPAHRTSRTLRRPVQRVASQRVRKPKKPTTVVMQAAVEPPPEPWRAALDMVRSGEVWVRVEPDEEEPSAPLAESAPPEPEPPPAEPEPPPERLPDKPQFDRILVGDDEVEYHDVTDADWWDADTLGIQEAVDWRAVLHPRDRRGKFRDVLNITPPPPARAVAAHPTRDLHGDKIVVEAKIGASRTRQAVPPLSGPAERLLNVEWLDPHWHGARLTERENAIDASLAMAASAHVWPTLHDNLTWNVEHLGIASGQFQIYPEVTEEIAASILHDHPEMEGHPNLDVRDELWRMSLSPDTLRDNTGGSTLLHELGHMLDVAMVYEQGDTRRTSGVFFASQAATSGAPEELLSVGQVRAWRHFLKTSVTPSVMLSNQPEHYVRDPRELWARAYAQWIATQDPSGELAQQFVRSDLGGWPANEWEPVGRAVEGVLQAHRLLHTEDRFRWRAGPGIEQPQAPPEVLKLQVDVLKWGRALSDPAPALRHFGFELVSKPGDPERWEYHYPADLFRHHGLLVATHPKGGPLDMHWEPGALPTEQVGALDRTVLPTRLKAPQDIQHVFDTLGSVRRAATAGQWPPLGSVMTPERMLRDLGFEHTGFDPSGSGMLTWELSVPEGVAEVRHHEGDATSLDARWIGKLVGGDAKFMDLSAAELKAEETAEAAAVYRNVRSMIEADAAAGRQRRLAGTGGQHDYLHVRAGGQTHVFEIRTIRDDTVVLAPFSGGRRIPDVPEMVLRHPGDGSDSRNVSRLLMLGASGLSLSSSPLATNDETVLSLPQRKEVPPQPKFTAELDWKADPEAASAAMAAYREQKTAWEADVRTRLSMGEVTWQEAHAAGFGSQAYPWEPLPNVPLYHATTALTKVRKDGLKTRVELGQDSGVGLGGGDDATISVTTSRSVAEAVAVGLREMRAVARGETSVADMLDQAAHGDQQSKPFLEDLVRHYQQRRTIDGVTEPEWKVGDPWPREIVRMLAGKKRAAANPGGSSTYPATREEKAAEVGVAPDVLTHTDIDQSMLGRGARMDWQMPASPQERIDEAVGFYKAYAAFREMAGGIENPMFFSSDTRALAQTPLSEIGIVTLRPAPGAQGHKVNAMDEWRTGSGKALVVEAPGPPAPVTVQSRGPLKVQRHGPGNYTITDPAGDEWTVTRRKEEWSSGWTWFAVHESNGGYVEAFTLAELKASLAKEGVQEGRVRAVERLPGPMGRTMAQRPDVGAFAARLADLADGEATGWHSSAFSGRVRREGEMFHLRTQGHHDDVFSGSADEVARWTADLSAEGAVRHNDPVATTDVAEAWDEARHPRDPKGRFAAVARGIERMGGSPDLAQAFASGTANPHDVYAAQRLANAHRGSRDYVPSSGARMVDEVLGTSSRPPVMVGGAITMHSVPGTTSAKNFMQGKPVRTRPVVVGDLLDQLSRSRDTEKRAREVAAAHRRDGNADMAAFYQEIAQAQAPRVAKAAVAASDAAKVAREHPAVVQAMAAWSSGDAYWKPLKPGSKRGSFRLKSNGRIAPWSKEAVAALGASPASTLHFMTSGSVPSTITTHYRGMPGTTEIDGVTHYASREHAQLVSESIPRSRVVKRQKGYVVMMGNKPHRSPFSGAFRGDSWADNFALAEAHRIERKLDEIHAENRLIEMAAESLEESLAGPHETIGTGKNWVTKEGGLPAAISRLAKDLIEKGHPKSQAIRMAVGIIKRWARGGGGVKPETQAVAARAVAEWERMKLRSHTH